MPPHGIGGGSIKILLHTKVFNGSDNNFIEETS